MIAGKRGKGVPPVPARTRRQRYRCRQKATTFSSRAAAKNERPPGGCSPSRPPLRIVVLQKQPEMADAFAGGQEPLDPLVKADPADLITLFQNAGGQDKHGIEDYGPSGWSSRTAGHRGAFRCPRQINALVPLRPVLIEDGTCPRGPVTFQLISGNRRRGETPPASKIPFPHRPVSGSRRLWAGYREGSAEMVV